MHGNVINKMNSKCLRSNECLRNNFLSVSIYETDYLLLPNVFDHYDFFKKNSNMERRMTW